MRSPAISMSLPRPPWIGRSEELGAGRRCRDLALFHLDLLDALDLDRVHVVGLCIGGWVALEMAVTSSGRASTRSCWSTAQGFVSRQCRAATCSCAPRTTCSSSCSPGLALPTGSSDGATPELEDIYDRNRAAAAKLSWSPRLCNPKLERWLHRIDVPTHIVWGGRTG